MTYRVKVGYHDFDFDNDNEAMVFANSAKIHAAVAKEVTIELINEKEEEDD